MQVYAYELLFRDGKVNCFPEIEPNEATSKLITNSHFTLGVEEISDGKTAFINFHTDTLLYRFPTSLSPDNVVIEITGNVDVSEKLVEACQHISGLGYKIAIDEYDFNSKWDVLFPFISIIKIDVSTSDLTKIESNIASLRETEITLIAEKVESREVFEQCCSLGFELFQGFFFTIPEVLKQKNIPSSKLNLLELMRESASEQFEFAKICQIIEKDVSLSYMLMRFINNPIMNKRNKINSLNHAINYMGEVEIKKFIALVAIANLGDEKPPELVHLSLVRAKFCELISIAKKDADNPPKGFLVGLFSLLDALLDQNMEKLMEKLPLSDDLKQALCGTNSVLRDYLVVARAFEYGDWKGVKHHSAKLELNQHMLHSFYNESIKWGSAMTRSIRN